MDPRIRQLLRIVDQAYDRKAWHGTTLRGAIRGLTPAAALWRPAPKRHNIWELVLHAAYWKYIVRRKLTGDTDLVFPRSPSNFPSVPAEPDKTALARDVALLGEQHRLLRTAIAALPARDLDRRAGTSKWTFGEHVSGIAAHDLYHAGQIQLLKRLRKG
jgi:hypothetical protein